MLLKQAFRVIRSGTSAVCSHKCYRLKNSRLSSSLSNDRGVITENLSLQHRKAKASGYVEDAFTDNRRVQVVGGNGGDGCIAFLRLLYNPLGGPSGGDGGNGGHIVLQADPSVTSLSRMPSIVRGDHGRNGSGDNCHGKNAEHTFVPVPLGTAVYEVQAASTSESPKKDVAQEKLLKLAELSEPEQRFVVARGGAGGRGNAFFLSNEQRAPTIAQKGARGETRTVHLEMTLVAHAGLVGVPNAGKSSLLAALTRARPKVAAYPFTTLSANVGVLQFDDCTQLRVADLPGLVANSHENRGLGYAFLRHVRKCVCLLFVLDASGSEEPFATEAQVDEQYEVHRVRLTPFQQFETVWDELRHFDASLLDRPHAFLFNKTDLFASQTQVDRVLERFKEQYERKFGKLRAQVICVSGRTSSNLQHAVSLVRTLYDASQASDTDAEK